MKCPVCDEIMHEDSRHIYLCVSCGYRDEVEMSTCGASYNNAGLMQGEKPKFKSSIHFPTDYTGDAFIQEPKLVKSDTLNQIGIGRTAETISINDAGEKLQSTEKTLKERGSRYGEFKTHAEISQQLKTIMFHGSDWDGMQEYQRESIEMICHKLARIANGDPFYDDNWRDIAGYAELVVKELNG